MPIYDQSYRHWNGTLKTRALRWWPIAKEGLRILLRKKLFVFLIMLSLMPCFAYGVGIYLLNRLGDSFLAFGLGRVLKIDARFFNSFLSTQIGFLLFISLFGGSGLIANDLKHNALQIYLSKPITRLDYLVGKFAILATMLSFITLIPAISLFLENVLLASDLAFLKEGFWILRPIVLYSLLLICSHSLLIMAFSSLTSSSRYASIGFGVVVLFSHMVSQTLQGIFRGDKRVVAVSFVENLKILGNKLFGVKSTYVSGYRDNPLTAGQPIANESWKLSLLIMGVLIASCIIILYRRIRGVEVVK